MKITRLETWLVEMKMDEPYSIAYRSTVGGKYFHTG